ncbi:hypothetical protein COCNU_02G011210 [Cocos nucifera]|uniref:NIF system FeS cluster assembly NifU C-terminal domain-containing protein n=1 Tax=Cocos nucifera TaxID=13894 RepID=A0A8K0I0B6_COCNU|nr:hypothetical protein COCNU_02G011210 [Cocos nucifera]
MVGEGIKVEAMEAYVVRKLEGKLGFTNNVIAGDVGLMEVEYGRQRGIVGSARVAMVGLVARLVQEAKAKAEERDEGHGDGCPMLPNMVQPPLKYCKKVPHLVKSMKKDSYGGIHKNEPDMFDFLAKFNFPIFNKVLNKHLPISKRLMFQHGLQTVKAIATPDPVVELPLTAENVESVLDEVRPYLIADGGNVALHEIDGNVVRLKLQGACGSCPSSVMTMKMGIEQRLIEKIPEIVAVEPITDEETGLELNVENIEKILKKHVSSKRQ